MCWQNGREDSRRHRANQGGWENGVMGTHIFGGTLKVLPELLVDELEETDHRSLGAKVDSGTGSWRVAGPAAWRQDPRSFSQHAPPPPQPPRPRCLPAPGSRQGSVHGLRQGATVQGSGCGLPAHSGTMERHVGWSWGAAGGIGTGAGETTPGAGEGAGRRGCGCSSGGLVSPKALGQRSASGVCGGGGTAGPGIQDIKDGARVMPFWGPKTPAKRFLPRPGSGGRSGWAERRHSGDPP